MKDTLVSKPVVVALAIFACAVSLSIIMLTHATTPNPGHPWTDVGNGNWQVSNTQTQVRTFIFPDADAEILTASSTLTWLARTITSSTTLSISTDTTIFVDASVGPITVTLPSASGTNVGVFLQIKKVDTTLANLVTIQPQSGQTIGALSNVSLANRGEAIMLVSNGTNWESIDRRNFDISAFASRSSTINQWYTSPHTGTALAASTGTAATLYAMPFVVSKTQTVDQMAINVTTLAAGGTVQVGIYNDGGNNYPGTLLVDVGAMSAAATGVKTSTTNLPITLDAGLYWLALNRNSATIAVRSFPPNALISILGYDPTFPTNAQFGWWVTQATGSLPSTFPAGGTAMTGLTSSTMPAIFVRFSQ